VLTQAHIDHGSDGKTAFGAQTHGVLLSVDSENFQNAQTLRRKLLRVNSYF
jgi:hypothetical protein